MSDLKPCPFCGGTNVAHGLFADNMMYVVCINCEASGPPSIAPEIGPLTATISKAHADWNRRSTLKPEGSGKFVFTSDDDATEVLKSYGHEEHRNGVIKADWNTFDERCKAAINYLCDEWDFVFEHVDTPPEPDHSDSLDTLKPEGEQIDAWQRIAADPELANARRKLSIHEIRLIIKHAKEAL